MVITYIFNDTIIFQNVAQNGKIYGMPTTFSRSLMIDTFTQFNATTVKYITVYHNKYSYYKLNICIKIIHFKTKNYLYI